MRSFRGTRGQLALVVFLSLVVAAYGIPPAVEGAAQEKERDAGPPATDETPAPSAAEPSDARALEGAWRLVRSRIVDPSGGVRQGRPHESFLLVADGFYSMSWAGGEPSPPYATRFRPTDEEALARYKALVFNAGRYSAVDGKLVIDPRIALVPEFTGGLGEFEYKLDGDNLELTWTKILAADGVSDPATAMGFRYIYDWERIEPEDDPTDGE